MYDPSTFFQEFIHNGGIGLLHAFGQDEFSPLEKIVQNQFACMQPASDRITSAAGHDVDADGQEQRAPERIVHEVLCEIAQQPHDPPSILLSHSVEPIDDFEPISSSLKEIWDRALARRPGPLPDEDSPLRRQYNQCLMTDPLLNHLMGQLQQPVEPDQFEQEPSLDEEQQEFAKLFEPYW